MPPERSSFSWSKSLIAIAVIVIAAIAGYYYSSNAATRANMKFFASSQYQNSLATLETGNYTQASQSLKSLESQAPTPEARMNVSYGVASSLAGAYDTCTAAAKYKEIAAASQNMQPAYAAFALDQLGSLTDTVMDNPTIVEDCIFNDAPYNAYLTQAKGNVIEAAILLFKHADALYPSAFSKFEIAHKEGRLIYAYAHATSSPMTKDQAIALAKDIQAQVAAGDQLASDPVLAQAFSQSQYVWPMWYTLRAGALDSSNLVLRNLTAGQIDGGYERALSFARGSSSEAMVASLDINSRLFYASSLSNGSSTARSKIADLLAGIGNAPQNALYTSERFIKYVSLNAPGTSPLADAFPKLAAYSPDFKKLLDASMQINVNGVK